MSTRLNHQTQTSYKQLRRNLLKKKKQIDFV